MWNAELGNIIGGIFIDMCMYVIIEIGICGTRKHCMWRRMSTLR